MNAGPTALYRCYDENGWLLYVGITLDPDRRFREHTKTFGWWPAVASTTVNWLPFGGRLAQDVETLAVCLEKPACNHREDTLPAECAGRMETGTWFDRAAQLREWRRWFAVWRDCQLQPAEREARASAGA
ncbi:GIY-YIG nuclease family protein [Kitasatospora sp. NPDC047058]|uniref:GIY-YIG nuclease family protein n=1 Tax=Kitasatospora sp. NPDC047058 TaxID=3155620 RepID=UPI0033FBEC19